MRLAMDKAGWRWGARFDQPGALVDVQLQMLVLEAVVLGGEANPTRALGEVAKIEKRSRGRARSWRVLAARKPRRVGSERSRK